MVWVQKKYTQNQQESKEYIMNIYDAAVWFEMWCWSFITCFVLNLKNIFRLILSFYCLFIFAELKYLYFDDSIEFDMLNEWVDYKT